MLPVRLKSPISNCLISRETTIIPAFTLKLAFKQFAVKYIQNKLGELVISQCDSGAETNCPDESSR